MSTIEVALAVWIPLLLAAYVVGFVRGCRYRCYLDWIDLQNAEKQKKAREQFAERN